MRRRATVAVLLALVLLSCQTIIGLTDDHDRCPVREGPEDAGDPPLSTTPECTSCLEQKCCGALAACTGECAGNLAARANCLREQLPVNRPTLQPDYAERVCGPKEDPAFREALRCMEGCPDCLRGPARCVLDADYIYLIQIGREVSTAPGSNAPVQNEDAVCLECVQNSCCALANDCVRDPSCLYTLYCAALECFDETLPLERDLCLELCRTREGLGLQTALAVRDCLFTDCSSSCAVLFSGGADAGTDADASTD